MFVGVKVPCAPTGLTPLPGRFSCIRALSSGSPGRCSGRGV